MKIVKLALVLLALATLSATAFATITAVNSGPGDLNTYQQTTNAPCVIGNSSCANGSFIDTQFNGTPNAQGSAYDLLSPGYTVGTAAQTGVTAPNTIPTSFIIAIDENISAGQGNEFLVFFKSWICTTAPTQNLPTNGVSTAVGPPSTGATVNGYGGCTISQPNSFTPTTPYLIPDAHNGNGFSDMILTGFSFNPNVHYVVFEASVSNDTDGMEQFFLVPLGTPVVPEPATMVLFGSGLASIAAWGRKRFFR